MKFLIVIALTFTTQAFAANICNFQETWEFKEALKAEEIKATKISKNHKRFTFNEKRMIHLALTLQDWLSGISREEALEMFSPEGEIEYYSIGERTYALVHYWPGDNEYGAFFEVINGCYRLVAYIGDSFIECK